MRHSPISLGRSVHPQIFPRPSLLQPEVLRQLLTGEDGDQHHPSFLNVNWGSTGTFYLLQEQQSAELTDTLWGKFTDFSLHLFSAVLRQYWASVELLLPMYWAHDLESTYPRLEDLTECCRKNGQEAEHSWGTCHLSSKMRLPDQKQFVALRPSSLMEDFLPLIFKIEAPIDAGAQMTLEVTLYHWGQCQSCSLDSSVSSNWFCYCTCPAPDGAIAHKTHHP